MSDRRFKIPPGLDTHKITFDALPDKAATNELAVIPVVLEIEDAKFTFRIDVVHLCGTAITTATSVPLSFLYTCRLILNVSQTQRTIHKGLTLEKHFGDYSKY